MAASTILSFTDLDGVSHKIATVSIFSIQDNSSYRIIILSSPTGKLKTSSTLDTLKEEALSLFQATVNGKEFLFNSLLVSKLVDYNGVCQITWQGGSRTTTEETVSVIEDRIDNLKTFRPVGTSIATATVNLDIISANTFYDVDASSSTVTITVTDQANTDFPIGSEWEFSPIDISNNISFVAGGSTTINSVDGNLKLDKAFSGALLKKTANNTFKLIGTLKA